MKHSFFRKKAKRAVSLLAAASVAAGQLATTTALNVTAIDTAPNAEISPQKTLWWGDEKPTTDTAVIYGDADGNKSVNAVDASLIARYAAKGDISDIDLNTFTVFFISHIHRHKNLPGELRKELFGVIHESKQIFILQKLKRLFTDIHTGGIEHDQTCHTGGQDGSRSTVFQHRTHHTIGIGDLGTAQNEDTWLLCVMQNVI